MSRAQSADLLKLAALLLSLLLVLSCAALAQDGRVQSSARAASSFRVAAGTPEGVPDYFEFEAGGFSYHVSANGNGRRTKGDKIRRFNLRVDGRIERVYFSEYGNDLLLVCELDYGESGAGVVTRLEQPSMRALWRQDIPSFNVGEPLRDGRHLYVTAVGYVAKLNLGTGEYVWEHEGLYRRKGGESFNAFDVPEVVGDTVSFKDKFSSPAHRVVVNRRTGKIVRIE